MHLWEAYLIGLLTLPVLLALGIMLGWWLREPQAARGDRAIVRRRMLGKPHSGIWTDYDDALDAANRGR